MHADALKTLQQAVMHLVTQALPKNLATTLARDIETKIEETLKNMALVPKHEFAAQEALLHTLEAQIAALEAKLDKLQSNKERTPPESDNSTN